jgi:hypothetical protein
MKTRNSRNHKMNKLSKIFSFIIIIAFVLMIKPNIFFADSKFAVDITELQINYSYIGNYDLSEFVDLFGEYLMVENAAFEDYITALKYKKCFEIYLKRDLLSNFIIENDCESFLEIYILGTLVTFQDNIDTIKQVIIDNGYEYKYKADQGILALYVRNNYNDELRIELFFKDFLLSRIKIKRRLINVK